MFYEIPVKYTDDIVRTAAINFLLRYAWRDATICLLILLTAAYFFSSKDWTLAAAIAGCGVVFFSLILWGGMRYVRSARAKFRALRNPIVTWRFADDTIRTESDLGSAEIRWDVISEVWQFPSVWLFFFGKSGYGYSTFPTRYLTQELKAFLESKLGLAEGKTP